MKKLIIFACLIFTINILFAQEDTIIRNQVYTSVYSQKMKTTLYVSYILYKGGGDCNRSSFKFHTNGMNSSATDKDFMASGFDKGHLVPAEDFAYDCDKMKETFYYYNVVAQFPNLNRGVWKKYEEEVRKLSQQDSLLVICGGVYEDVKYKINTTDVVVPTKCFKVVYSLKTKKLVHCLLFENQKEKNSVKKITTKQLKVYIGKYKRIRFYIKF